MATTGNLGPDRAGPGVGRSLPGRRRRSPSGAVAGALSRADEDPADELVASHAVAARRVDRAAPQTDAGMDGAARLARTAAHDFNNVLAAVLGNLQLLQRRAGNDERAGRLIGSAIDAALRGADLARGLLAYAHRREVEPRPVDVNAVVAAMAGAIGRTAGPCIEVTIGLADGLPTAEADPEGLQSAILSLVANARDAMPDGGTLTIETAKVVIDGATAARSPTLTAGTRVCVSVSDTGCGMAPDLVDRAFEPFFSTKPDGKGSGLGLSLVSDFVRRSGGHLTVGSEPGRGTRFRIFLPAPRDAAGPGPRRGDTAP